MASSHEEEVRSCEQDGCVGLNDDTDLVYQAKQQLSTSTSFPTNLPTDEDLPQQHQLNTDFAQEPASDETFFKCRDLEGGALDPCVPKDKTLEDPPQEEVLNFPKQECRILLLGKTGNGKSATGNTILNTTGKGPDECFHAERSLTSVTEKCRRLQSMRFGIKILVVDTPGFFDTERTQDEINREIARSIEMVSPGPHVLLFVIRLDTRFTEEEAQCLQELKDLFGEDIKSHMMAVFTHGEEVNSTTTESDSQAKCISKCPKLLQEFLKEINNRYVVISNTTEKREERDAQVQQLLIKIREMLALCGDLPFNNDLLEDCEAIVKCKEEELVKLLESESYTPEQARKLVQETMGSRTKMERMLRSRFAKENLDLLEQERRLKSLLEIREKAINRIKQKLEKVQKKSKCAQQRLREDIKKLEEKIEKKRCSLM